MNTFKVTPSNIGGLVDFVTKELQKSGAVYVQVVSEKKAKSDAQNRTFHKLIGLWHKSGHASYDDYDTLRNYYKLKAGIIECYLYIDGEKIERVATREEIPDTVPRASTFCIAGSWSRATKEQAMQAIDMVIEDIMKSGYSSKELDSLLNGLNEWR